MTGAHAVDLGAPAIASHDAAERRPGGYCARCRCGWEHRIDDPGDALVALVSHLSTCIRTPRIPGVTWAGLGGAHPRP